MKKRIGIICKNCGSSDVRRVADAAWNEQAQEWQLVAVYDNATCEVCEKETYLEEKDLSEFSIVVQRTSWDEATFEVTAPTQIEACNKAVAAASDHVFGSGNAEYEVMSINKKGER